jgi:tetratricopeptide (TPR) repeat protein
LCRRSWRWRHSSAWRSAASSRDGYALLAEVGVQGGDLNEALAAIRRAKLLNPRHPSSNYWIEGHILFQLARYDEAQPLLEEAVAHNPKFYRGLITLAANYGLQKKTEVT